MMNTLSILVLALGVALLVWGIVWCFENQSVGVQLLSAGTMIVFSGLMLR